MRLVSACLSLLSFFGITALAQQAPDPVLQKDVFNATRGSFRQDVCDREAIFARGDTTLGLSLQGLELHVYIADNEFFSLNNNGVIDPAYPGIMVTVMDEIARRGEFTWRNSYAVYDEAVLPPGKTYNEVLEYGTETYDVVVSWWFETTQRKSLGISFPEPWMDGSMILVAQQDDEDNRGFEAFLWLKPFDNTVWVMTLFSIVASGVVYWILELIDPRSDRSRFRNPAKGIYLSFITFMGHFDDFQPKTVASRLLAVSLAFWALLTCSAYTANLASFLVIQNQPPTPIQSVEDAVRSRAPVCVVGTYATDTALSTAFPNAIVVRKTTEEESLLAVVNGECTVALTGRSTWEFFEGQSQVNGECNLEWVGRTFRSVGAGFATKSDSGTKCTSLVRDVLNLHMGEMKSDGFLEEAWSQYLSQVSTVDCSYDDAQYNSKGDDDHGQLRMENMAGIFVLHYGLSFLAIVLAYLKVRFNILSCSDNKNPFPSPKRIHERDVTGATEETERGELHEPSSRKPPAFQTGSYLSDVEYYDGDVDEQVLVLRREIKRMQRDHQRQLDAATQNINRQLTEMMALLLEKSDKDVSTQEQVVQQVVAEANARDPSSEFEFAVSVTKAEENEDALPAVKESTESQDETEVTTEPETKELEPNGGPPSSDLETEVITSEDFSPSDELFAVVESKVSATEKDTSNVVTSTANVSTIDDTKLHAAGALLPLENPLSVRTLT